MACVRPDPLGELELLPLVMHVLSRTGASGRARAAMWRIALWARGPYPWRGAWSGCSFGYDGFVSCNDGEPGLDAWTALLNSLASQKPPWSGCTPAVTRIWKHQPGRRRGFTRPRRASPGFFGNGARPDRVAGGIEPLPTCRPRNAVWARRCVPPVARQKSAPPGCAP